jgi:DNA-binding NarL/FixJ family response regulator
MTIGEVLTDADAVGTVGGDGSTIRVVIADDHEPIRRSMRSVLECEAGIDVVAEADGLESTVRSVRLHRPHVLVCDLRLPRLSNVATIQLIREHMARTRIVLATMELNPAFAQLAFASGATGFVSKDLADAELVPAVRAAATGERYLSPRVSRSIGSFPGA